MQSVQRRFGRLLPRTADESQVSVLLKDFDDADKMLAKVFEEITSLQCAVANQQPCRLLMLLELGETRGETYLAYNNVWSMGFKPFTPQLLALTIRTLDTSLYLLLEA